MTGARNGLWMRAAHAVVLAACVAIPSVLSAQAGNSPLRRASRASLDSLAARYDLAAQSPAYSPVLRTEAQARAAAIRTRLTQGDFQPGDRIELVVEQYPELTDTLAVQGNRTLQLQGIGALPLEGVLRSELEEHVRQAVARIIRDPRLQARAFVRIGLNGAFNAPGYYLVDSDLPLTELMMRGGGPARDAEADEARIDRGNVVVVPPPDFREALRMGATVEQLGLREGDTVVIPDQRSWFSSAREWIFVIPSLIGVLAIFR